MQNSHSTFRPAFFNPRYILVALHDVLAACMAWLIAYWLRFNLSIPQFYLDAALLNLVWVAPLQALIFQLFGLYRGVWRFASLPDLQKILKAVGVAALATPVVLTVFRVDIIVPRTVLVLDPLLLLLIMGGSRLAYRASKERRLSLQSLKANPVLIAGAGSAADFLLRELARTPSNYRVVGLLDDDRNKIGRQIQGIPVLGALGDLVLWAKKIEVEEVIMAMPAASHELRRRLSEQCADAGLRLLTVPSLDDLMNGRVVVSQLRSIELDDLLGRDPVELDDSGLNGLLTGHVVLVTGAGGSIGSELCRQIAHFRPGRLVLFEQGEFALYQIEQEFRALFPDVPITCLIGDVKDRTRVGQVMRDFCPAVVFHAAAYKHVPLMEESNALQALKNNVLGTWVVAQEAKAAGVGKFVLISTDKAVNPTNVMGASKRLAEMVCQGLQASWGSGGEGSATRFISVRFGNVLGSSGSVIPKFQKQIEAGGPVTVTHPEITRFFMSIPEAAQLVLQAGLMGRGGEIYVLDMGEPVRIADLASLMIRLSGKTQNDIRIEYTGLRPGEKLYEELLADSESTLPTPHPKLRVAGAREVDERTLAIALDWIATTPDADDSEVRQKLVGWVPEYQPAVHSSISP